MSWKQIVPQNSGGGRKRKQPAATLYKSGQLVLNHAAADLLGTPPRVILEVSTTSPAIRLRPTTAGDSGGFALSGGGNSQWRLMCKNLVRDHPDLCGPLGVSKAAHGLLLCPEPE
ncbi:MAG: hypothetical protein KDD78_16980 [Caldilineaceae bacterium]|nr:hypothetical protein [Caldilineaceae bacterium]